MAVPPALAELPIVVPWRSPAFPIKTNAPSPKGEGAPAVPPLFPPGSGTAAMLPLSAARPGRIPGGSRGLYRARPPAPTAAASDSTRDCRALGTGAPERPSASARSGALQPVGARLWERPWTPTPLHPRHRSLTWAQSTKPASHLSSRQKRNEGTNAEWHETHGGDLSRFREKGVVDATSRPAFIPTSRMTSTHAYREGRCSRWSHGEHEAAWPW